MAYINVQVNQTRLERRIYYAKAISKLEIANKEWRHFLEWYDNEKCTGSSVTTIKLPEIGEYKIRIYVRGGVSKGDAMKLSLRGSFLELLQKPSEWSLEMINRFLFRKTALLLDELCFDCFLGSMNGPVGFSCGQIVMIVTQIV